MRLDMKKSFLALIWLSATIFCMHAQQRGAFTSVPLVSGNVVFERFIHTNNALSVDQKYAKLVAWGQNKFVSNPMLTGIRFDDNARTMTVSLRTNLNLPNGETTTMIHRFDVSISNVGGMVVIRDIAYQITNGDSIFPTTHTAEQTITDRAIAINDEHRERRIHTRTATLAFFNELSAEIEALFR